MIEIKIPEDKKLAASIGKALIEWASDEVVPVAVEEKPEVVVKEEAPVEVVEEEKPKVPQLDANGVMFNEDYCMPELVKSGPRKGFWKAKKGLSNAEFKEWYDEKNPNFVPEPESLFDEEESNDERLKKAFATPNNPDPLLPPVGSEPPQEEAAPSNAAQLFAWISEKQASGFLENDAVNKAYKSTGINVPMMFPPNTEEEIQQNVNRIFEILKGELKDV